MAADPGALLGQINRGLREILVNSSDVMFVTATYAVLDVENCAMSYAIAGHPPPICISASAPDPCSVLQAKGNPALGLFPGATFQSYEISLHDGDALLFYTDGLIEVDGRDGASLVFEEFLAAVRRHAALPLPALVRELLSEIQSYAVHGFDDDVCILAAGIGPEPNEPSSEATEGEDEVVQIQ